MYKSVLQLNQVPPHAAQLHPDLVSISLLRAQVAGGAHLGITEGCVGQPASEALNHLTLFTPHTHTLLREATHYPRYL